MNKISIALCTFNGERYLQEQLASIASQSRLPDELIICDDVSNDKTVDILLDFSKSANFSVKLIVNPIRLGFVQNFEKAIRLCSGDFIFISDQDDVWQPEKIEIIEQVFNDNPEAGYVFSDAWITDKNLVVKDRLWRVSGFLKARKKYSQRKNQFLMILRSNFIYGNTMAFRSCHRKVVLPIESASPVFSHDAWISSILSALGHFGIAISRNLICYRQHETQVVGVGKLVWIDAIRNIKNRISKKTYAYYFDRVATLDSLKKRLLDVGPQSSFFIDTINNFIHHLKIRAILSTVSAWTRFKLISREFFSGRYSLFSSSWMSATLDFFIKANNKNE